MTTRFLLLLFLSVTPLLGQDSPREWEKELADRYFSYGSFVARYTGTGPAGKEINVVLAEERESRSALVRVTLNDRPMVDALHIPPGQPGAGLFLSYLGEPKTVTGLHETVTSLLDSMQAIGQMFTNKPVPKQEWQFVTNLSFLKHSLNGGLSFQVAMEPTWLKDKLTRPARIVQVKKDAVHFPLPDGSLVAIHKESGLLANHKVSRRGGNIELRLLELKPLVGLKALKELCADIE